MVYFAGAFASNALAFVDNDIRNATWVDDSGCVCEPSGVWNSNPLCDLAAHSEKGGVTTQ